MAIVLLITKQLIFYVHTFRNTNESIGSKQRRGKHGKTPHLSVSVKYCDYSACPFVCEIKTPTYIDNLNVKEYQKLDFVKLCNMMKDELD